MKNKIKIIVLIGVFMILISGCGLKNADDVIKKLSKKINDCNSYYAEGTMEIVNNENTYTYKVKASYKKQDYYKIDLINTLNNHEQVILKNDEGVYVVTPSLNKSFKFQSDWPYNNSQVYLLNSIVEDISEDDNRTFKAKDDGYYFISSVNYPNNKSLTKQNVYIDKNMKIKKIEVMDKNGKAQITMNFDKIIYNKKFADNYFELSNLIKIENNNSNVEKNPSGTSDNNQSNNSSNIESDNEQNEESNNNQNSTNNSSNIENNNSSSDTTNSTNNNTNPTTDANKENDNSNNKQAASIDDVVYPMYLPSNTTLANKEVVNTSDGERLILTFSGDNPFVLVEETLSYNDDALIIPVSGNFDFLNDVVGVVNDNSVTFESNGIGYYIVSDKLKKTELVNIARSISVLPVSK